MGATGQSKEKRYFSEHSRSISKNSFEEYWEEKDSEYRKQVKKRGFWIKD